MMSELTDDIYSARLGPFLFGLSLYQYLSF